MAKILIVDDEIELASIVAKILRDKDHNVRVIGHSDEAYSTIDDDMDIDLLLLDLHMPKPNGIDILHKLKNPKYKIIIFTGFDEGLKSNLITKIIEKPVTTPDELLKKIESVL